MIIYSLSDLSQFMVKKMYGTTHIDDFERRL